MAAINVRLPQSVRLLDATEVEDGFHARFQARIKRYRYRIWNAEVASPFEHQYAWHLQHHLDVEAMAAAAVLIEGRHDFSAFQGTGVNTQSSERTVFTSHVSRDEALITYEISGDGFLRHMVRSLVGTARGDWPRKAGVPWMAEVLASRDRACAGRTAPAQGLFLVSVDYDQRASTRPAVAR